MRTPLGEGAQSGTENPPLAAAPPVRVPSQGTSEQASPPGSGGFVLSGHDAQHGNVSAAESLLPSALCPRAGASRASPGSPLAAGCTGLLMDLILVDYRARGEVTT